MLRGDRRALEVATITRAVTGSGESDGEELQLKGLPTPRQAPIGDRHGPHIGAARRILTFEIGCTRLARIPTLTFRELAPGYGVVWAQDGRVMTSAESQARTAQLSHRATIAYQSSDWRNPRL